MTQGPPPPPPPPAVGSVALRVNDTWSYRGGEDNAEETVATITSAANGTVVLRSVSTGPNGTHTVVSTLAADTLALQKLFDDALGFEVKFSPPLPVLIPASDHEYRGNITIPTPFGAELAQPANATIRFLGMEEIDVPAGRFVTYRYNATIDSTGFRDFHQDNELWFSPVAKQAVRTVVDGIERELLSYRLS